MLLSGGFIAAIVFFVIAVALITLAIVAIRREWFEYEDKELPYFGGIAGFIALIIVALTMIPWPLRYHVWEPHSGTVAKIEQRLVTDGSSSANITKEMAFWMEGEDAAYITSDIRVQTVKVGDTVELRRKDNKQWGGTNYWNIKFLGTQATQ